MQKQYKFDLNAFLALFEEPFLAEQVYEPYHILGVITAIASAPESISISEWMPVLWREENSDMEFASEVQANLFTRHVIGWWNECNQKFSQQDELFLPESITFSELSGVSRELKDFSIGYLNGYDWLKEVWDEVLDEKPEQHDMVKDYTDIDKTQPSELDSEDSISELSALIGMITMTMLQCVVYPKIISDDEDIPNFIEEISAKGDLVKFIGHVLSDIGGHGHLLAEASRSQLLSTSERMFQPFIETDLVVNPDDVCPCGSGKRYKKCCLH